MVSESLLVAVDPIVGMGGMEWIGRIPFLLINPILGYSFVSHSSFIFSRVV